MTAAAKPFVSIVLPDLFGRSGGIARISRALTLATARYCDRNGFGLEVMVLNDRGQPDAHYLPFGSYSTFHGDRVALGKAVLARSQSPAHLTTLFGHVYLAALGALFPLVDGERRRRYAVVTHGIEVWRGLPLYRRLALQLAREIWAVSAYTARQVEDLHGVPDGVLRVVHNALDPHWTGGEGGGESGERAPYVLAVTRLDRTEQYKGIDTCIAAMAQLAAWDSDLKLVVVGAGDDLPRLKQLALERGVAARVDFRGGVDDPTLRALYRDCRFFALPSRKEGFGLVYLEAMAAKKAVVAADSGGTPEVVVPNSTGLLVPFGSPSRLAEAFRRLSGDAALAQRLGDEGFRRLNQRFLFGHYEERVAQGLDRLLGRRAAPASAASPVDSSHKAGAA